MVSVPDLRLQPAPQPGSFPSTARVQHLAIRGLPLERGFEAYRFNFCWSLGRCWSPSRFWSSSSCYQQTSAVVTVKHGQTFDLLGTPSRANLHRSSPPSSSMQQAQHKASSSMQLESKYGIIDLRRPPLYTARLGIPNQIFFNRLRLL